MTENCNRHLFDLAEDQCRQCQQAFCGDCLVYTNGAGSPPMCINCALKRSGVRGSKRTKPSWRMRRTMAKVEKSNAEMRAARQRSAGAPPTDDAVDADSWDRLDGSRWDLGPA